MGIIVSLIIGGVIGWLASLVMKTGAQMGVIANIVVGIIGAALGFWLAGSARDRGGGFHGRLGHQHPRRRGADRHPQGVEHLPVARRRARSRGLGGQAGV